MVSTYYIRLLHTRADRPNGILMSLLLLVAETINVSMTILQLLNLCKLVLNNFYLILARLWSRYYVDITLFLKSNFGSNRIRVRIRGYKIFVFRKIWCAFFSKDTRFEIHPFALLPTTYGFSFSVARLIQSYLSNRNQRRKINNAYSSWEEILFGVPQGFTLRSLMFNMLFVIV